MISLALSMHGSYSGLTSSHIFSERYDLVYTKVRSSNRAPSCNTYIAQANLVLEIYRYGRYKAATLAILTANLSDTCRCWKLKICRMYGVNSVRKKLQTPPQSLRSPVETSRLLSPIPERIQMRSCSICMQCTCGYGCLRGTRQLSGHPYCFSYTRSTTDRSGGSEGHLIAQWHPKNSHSSNLRADRHMAYESIVCSSYNGCIARIRC